MASALIKFIWTSSGTYSQIATEPPFLGLGKAATLAAFKAGARHGEVTSSENSVSMEGSNSDDEPVGTSSILMKYILHVIRAFPDRMFFSVSGLLPADGSRTASRAGQGTRW